MIIDCHGHYTIEPKPLLEFRKKQTDNLNDSKNLPKPSLTISDDEIRETLATNALKMQQDRGTNVTFFSPRASTMAHHIGDARVSADWTRVCNDAIAQVCRVYPDNYVGVGMLPQSPGVAPETCIPEMERCVKELGFVGFNLNPDPSGGMWTTPPLIDKYWYKLYEKLVELDTPVMVHVSSSCNPNFHATGAHYINADTTAFMQFIEGDIFKDFPTLRMIIPHGGGAVPYHWGRYRGLADMLKRPDVEEMIKGHVYFDTCVYHQPGINLLAEVIPTENILFASELLGAVRGKDPKTGFNFDDTKRYVDKLPLDAAKKKMIFEDNTRKVFPRSVPKLDAIAKRTAA